MTRHIEQESIANDERIGMDWNGLPAFFGPRDLSAFMGIGITKAYQLSRSEGFPAIRIGKNIRISRDGLRRWVQRQIEEDMESMKE